jgi:aquaporin Z
MGEASLESKLVAEALGVFALTFIGAGSIIVGGLNGGEAALLTVAIAHGLVLAVAVTATMNISGAHINPAITIAFLMTRRIDGTTAGLYIVAQLVGGVVAGGILFGIFGEGNFAGTPAPGMIEGVTLSASKVIVIEIVLTFLLMLAIMGTAVDPRAPAIGGWGIGLMVTADILMGGPLTGAAMNPARHFGTALFEGLLGDAWMYWVGPIIGAGLCAMIYDRFLMADE